MLILDGEMAKYKAIHIREFVYQKLEELARRENRTLCAILNEAISTFIKTDPQADFRIKGEEYGA